jgi:hypothetical protein
MSKYYAMVPTSYVEKLQQSGKREKARAFIEYFLDMHNDSVNSIRFYQKSWNLSSSGSTHKWIKEFKIEISKFFTYWELKNETHYSSVQKESEQKQNTLKNKSEHQNNTTNTINTKDSKTQVNTIKNQSEHKVNKDSNTNNIYNINADSNESATTKSSNKKSYSANFEILWNRYDKKTSNKGRSQTIYKKKWKNTDIKILIEAIDEYKSKTDFTYLKDFDGFLNGVIDTYIPRRAWVVDTNKNKHIGWFYDSRNKFISDTQEKLTIESQKIADYIEANRFGYVA